MAERAFIFVGVTTGSSSIMRIFPRWRDALGLGADVEIAGRDVEVDAAPERYRELVEELRDDPLAVGALVTTHKIGVYEAAGDLFAGLDELARLCGEVSCIARRGDGLYGRATDPISAGRTLERILDPRHFRDGGGHVLCMGAGGSGTAIALYLAARRPDGDHPRRLVVTDRSAARLVRLQKTLAALDHGVELELVHVDGARMHGRLLERLPARSLVVNATGMGKDLPGSPLGEGARFPEGAIAWELNYRGELGFLHQARAQAAERELAVEDGWIYFIHGWTAVIEEVFQRPIDHAELELLAREAAFARPTAEENR